MGSKFGKPGLTKSFSRNGSREKMLFVFAAAMTLTLVATFVVVANMKQSSSAPAAPAKTDSTNIATIGGNTVAVYAPPQNIPAGTNLSEITFRKLDVPKHTVTEDTIRNPGEFKALYARVDLVAGQPVTRNQTTTQPSTTDSVSLKLTPGNRAVSIEVDETSGLEGHAQPGTHVDIVLTHSKGGELMSSIIVENARVISYGGDTKSDASRGTRQIRVSRTMTLDVSTADALKISTARQMGRLSLIMRAAEDNKAAETSDIEATDLGKSTLDKKGLKPACNKGKVKLGGKDFLLGCDGSMTPVGGDEKTP